MLTYLAARPDVDAARLGCTGVSLGGMHAWLLAALDPRVACAAPLIGVQVGHAVPVVSARSSCSQHRRIRRVQTRAGLNPGVYRQVLSEPLACGCARPRMGLCSTCEGDNPVRCSSL